MTNTEKKIAEIREKHSTGHYNYSYEVRDAIRFLLDELEQEKEQNMILRKENLELREKIKEDEKWFMQASENVSRMQQEREKLIEGLRVYLADLAERHHEAMQEWDHEADMYEQGAACAYDIAESMLRDILHEIGVTVE